MVDSPVTGAQPDPLRRSQCQCGIANDKCRQHLRVGADRFEVCDRGGAATEACILASGEGSGDADYGIVISGGTSDGSANEESMA